MGEEVGEETNVAQALTSLLVDRDIITCSSDEDYKHSAPSHITNSLILSYFFPHNFSSSSVYIVYYFTVVFHVNLNPMRAGFFCLLH